VGTAVHAAVGGDEELALSVEHLHRPLRRRSRVQVRQLVSTPHHTFEDRKVGSDRSDVEL
jgi:hypothetical protein